MKDGDAIIFLGPRSGLQGAKAQEFVCLRDFLILLRASAFCCGHFFGGPPQADPPELHLDVREPMTSSGPTRATRQPIEGPIFGTGHLM